MAYITETVLKQYAQRQAQESKIYRYIKASSFGGVKSVFLSHSHEDKTLVEGLIRFLDDNGITAYVDWKDSGMPTITTRETAEKIKGKINLDDFFLILATPNALVSRWVPWEIGIADQMKKDKVGVLPVADNSGQFKGNEYLQLYTPVVLPGFSYTIPLFEYGAIQKTTCNLNEWLSGK